MLLLPKWSQQSVWHSKLSRCINLLFYWTVLNGNNNWNIYFYCGINMLYASLGQARFDILEKFAFKKIYLKEWAFSSQKGRVGFSIVDCLTYLLFVIWKVQKWSATTFIIIAEKGLATILFVNMWSISEAVDAHILVCLNIKGKELREKGLSR